MMTYQQAIIQKKSDTVAPAWYNGRRVPCRDVRCVSWAKCRDCGRAFSEGK